MPLPPHPLQSCPQLCSAPAPAPPFGRRGMSLSKELALSSQPCRQRTGESRWEPQALAAMWPQGTASFSSENRPERARAQPRSRTPRPPPGTCARAGHQPALLRPAASGLYREPGMLWGSPDERKINWVHGRGKSWEGFTTELSRTVRGWTVEGG